MLGYGDLERASRRETRIGLTFYSIKKLKQSLLFVKSLFHKPQKIKGQ